MTAHRGTVRPRRPRLRALTSARTRAMASLLAVAALAGGMSVQGTFAFFSDTATLQTGSFTSGTLDLTLDAAAAGLGTGITKANLALPDMVPGESVAQVVAVRSAGTTGLTYTTSGTATAGLAGQLVVSLSAGATAGNTGTAAGGNRAGTCTGGTALATDKTLTTTASALSTARTLGTGAAENICVKIVFSAAADNTYQGQTGQSVSILFDAKQVGA